VGHDSGNGTSDQGSFVDPDDDAALEPEILRWLGMYAEAADDRHDATVIAIVDEMNRLLRPYRVESAAHRADYTSRLRTLTEQMPVMLWTTDAGLRVTTFAGGGLAAVDIDPSSTVSLSLSVVLGMDTPSSEALDAHKRSLHGQPAVFEYDRRSRSYLVHVQPLSDPNGVIVGTIGLAIDVTERKRAEERLARREQQLAEAQRLAHVGSWEFEFATRRLSWSEEHYRIFGLPELDLVTPELALEQIHADDVERTRTAWEATLRTGEAYACDFRIVRPDGDIRVIHSRGAVVRDASGQFERMVGTAQDVTSRAGRPAAPQPDDAAITACSPLWRTIPTLTRKGRMLPVRQCRVLSGAPPSFATVGRWDAERD